MSTSRRYEMVYRSSFSSGLGCSLFQLTLIFWAAFLGLAVQSSDTWANETKHRAMLITGVDYAGHQWKTTAPLVRKILEADGDIEVRIVEDIEILATDLIFDFQVLIFHFKNYDPPRRAAAVYSNIQEFQKRGGGLLLLHFACGAFEQWPEYVMVAGRIWDREKRPHDPWGRFTVRIVSTEHPITVGLSDFEIEDELYTCLKGETPIKVLAEARSKVDGLTYPMAFVVESGAGRVFHTVLGHDARAFESPTVQVLLRRAVRWAAGP